MLQRLSPLLVLSVLYACTGESDRGADPGPAADTPAAATAGEARDFDPGLPPLPIEQTGIVNSLPERYPEHWFLVHDVTFAHMFDGKVVVVDATADTVPEQFRGSFNVSFIGNINESTTRNEIYATETFHTRGARGDRIDVLTIFDRSTLAVLDEVVWPTPKRFTGMPERYAIQAIDDGRLVLVFNFNPATSVTVIDADTREILNEVAIPGCSLIYPTGARGFSSVCGNGGMLTTQLDADGELVAQTRLDPFFDSDTSPIFERPAVIDGIAYFPSFDSEIVPVDLTGPVAAIGEPWSLVSEAEKAESWRPGGIALIDRDDLGRFYILMHPDGGDGTQGAGGSELWIYEAADQKRVQRLPLKTWGLSVAVSRGQNPVIMISNAEMTLDIYDALSGDHLRTIDGLGFETPLIAHGAR